MTSPTSRNSVNTRSAKQGDIPTLGGLIGALHQTRILLSDARRQRDLWAIAFGMLVFMNVSAVLGWFFLTTFA